VQFKLPPLASELPSGCVRLRPDDHAWTPAARAVSTSSPTCADAVAERDHRLLRVELGRRLLWTFRCKLGHPLHGLIDVDQAISQSPSVQGIKFLSLGGGNAAGMFTSSTLSAITAKASAIKKAGFAGVMYDVEEVKGPSSTMSPLFAQSFAAMRNAGLLVGVTTSHSAPYACDTPEDATNILRAWCADPNIDIISPQLYSSGSESAPELVPSNFCKEAGCTWDIYTSCKAAIAPSIVRSSHYAASKDYFDKNVGRTLSGYIVWAQSGELMV